MSKTNNSGGSPSGSSQEVLSTRDAAAASAQELRQFVAGLRGKKPQEMLGQIANSGLIQGVVISTFATFVIMAVFTAGPYFLYGKPVPLAKADKPAAIVEEASKPTPEANQPIASSPTDSKANAQKTLEKLGESETKMSDPKVNPLEKELDDILDTKK